MANQEKFTYRAEKAFTLLPKKARIRIEIELENFAAAYTFHRPDVKKVKGCSPDKPRYRIRIDEYHATFRIIQDNLVIYVVVVVRKKNFEY